MALRYRDADTGRFVSFETATGGEGNYVSVNIHYAWEGSQPSLSDQRQDELDDYDDSDDYDTDETDLGEDDY